MSDTKEKNDNKKEEHDKTKEKDDSLKEAVNTYYKLKESYESENNKEKNNIIHLPGLSWREKRAEFLKIKQKCINCKRPIGTLFSTKVIEDERHLIALCGDRHNPCPLNIDINLAIIHNIEDEIQYDEDEINKYKKNIIIDKNDLLFGYIDSEEAVQRFDKIKDSVEHSTKMHGILIQELDKTTMNETKRSEINNLKEELYKSLTNYNALMNEYNTSQNVLLVKDAVQLYVNNIQPRLVEIRNKTYSYVGVDYNELTNIFYLVEDLVTVRDLEWNLSINEPAIVSFKVGLDGFEKKRSKKANEPSIAVSAIPDIKEKVKKVKKVKEKKTKKIKLDIDEDADVEKEENIGGGGKIQFDLEGNQFREYYLDPEEKKYKMSADEDADDDDDGDDYEPLTIGEHTDLNDITDLSDTSVE
jgi:hypothetical protein